MAVYDGVPSIRLEGDEKRALALIPDAKVLLYKAQTFVQRAEVSTFSMSRRVDDDSFIYVLVANEQNIIHISVSPEVPEELNPPEISAEPSVFPDFYSGLVYGGILSTAQQQNPDGTVEQVSVCSAFSPTPNCVFIHDELTNGRQTVPRLAVRPWPAYGAELSNPDGFPEYSQYTRLRSSMYSGMMKKVVQIVMGLGRIGKVKMRDPLKQEPDSKYIKDVDQNGVQVRFDWRFVRTHGITVGADGRLWLVEISMSRGVLARPLPIFPHSTTAGFRDRAEARKDTAMVTALDELGCLPTGEAFPATAAQLDSLLASGDILRLLDSDAMKPFYDCSAYSSALGWAFNPTGSVAHNTAYYYGEDGFQRGVWYAVNISIGAIVTEREPGQPISSGNASLVRISEGFIYCPPAKRPSPARYVPIKFHEPLLPGLLSHEGVPSIEAAGLPAPYVDTTMFVAFMDGDLKAVKYYRNPISGAYNTVDDPRYPGECILAGDWTITTTSGSRSFPSMMYTNDFDDRKTLQEHTTITTIKSEDKGYDPPKFSDFIDSPETCYIWRERIFKQTVETDQRGGETLMSAVAIPQFSREAYYYAVGSRYNLGRSGTTSVSYANVLDPNAAYGWRCFPRINAPPFPPNRPDCNTKVCRGDAPCSFGGVGYHKERRVVCLVYDTYFGGPWVIAGSNGDTCYEFADSGPWLQLCDIVDGFNQPGMDKTPSSTSWNKGGDEKADLYFLTSGYGGPIKLPVTPDRFFFSWMRPSPDPESGYVQFITAEHSGIGQDMIVYDVGLSSYNTEIRTYGYAPDSINPGDGYPAFIGVNQP